MQLDYFFFYAEANIVCIIVLTILLIHDRRYSSQQEKQIWFNRTIIAHIMYFISDIFWAGVLNGNIPKTRFLVVTFNFVNYILLSLMAYVWFMYMASTVGLAFRNRNSVRRLCLLPMIGSVLTIVIAYIVSPYFWISETNELNPLYYPLFIVAPAIYLIAAFIFSMRKASQAESRQQKILFRLVGIYPMSVMLFGLIQPFSLNAPMFSFSLNAPMFCFGCTIMIINFYIENMQLLVSVDALTRLNNRGQIDRYMEQNRFRENVQTYVMMIDIDRFKQINDTYGHAEGDRALVLAAESLKQAAEQIKTPVFLGRYGGDEFVVFLQTTEGEETLKRAVEIIRGAMREKQRENQLPYGLEISVGYDMLKNKDDTMAACLVRADEKLYQDKRMSGRGR